MAHHDRRRRVRGGPGVLLRVEPADPLDVAHPGRSSRPRCRRCLRPARNRALRGVAVSISLTRLVRRLTGYLAAPPLNLWLTFRCHAMRRKHGGSLRIRRHGPSSARPSGSCSMPVIFLHGVTDSRRSFERMRSAEQLHSAQSLEYHIPDLAIRQRPGRTCATSSARSTPQSPREILSGASTFNSPAT